MGEGELYYYYDIIIIIIIIIDDDDDDDDDEYIGKQAHFDVLHGGDTMREGIRLRSQNGTNE
jgi:hypothetical protein